MSERTGDERVTSFCMRLAALDAGERACLKRSAGKTMAEALDALGVFFRALPPGVPAYQQGTYFLLATMYPLADAGKTGNLGAALHRARRSQNGKGLDRRMMSLLDADEAQLPFRLRQAIRLLAGQDVAVEWPQLLDDLLHWNHPQRFVQQEWARAYFID